MPSFDVAREVPGRTKRLGAANDTAHVNLPASMDFDVVVEFCLARECPLAAVDVTLERLERRVQALVARQIA